jgi:exonuclease VII small subunit
MDNGHSERISVDRRELEAFISEIQDLVERHRKLLDKVNELTQYQKELEERLRAYEQEGAASAEEGNKFLTDATTTMKRLVQEADRLLTE